MHGHVFLMFHLFFRNHISSNPCYSNLDSTHTDTEDQNCYSSYQGKQQVS